MGHDSRLNPFALGAATDLAATTLDARGRVLQEGDEIILNVRGPIYFRVAQISPVPPGIIAPGTDPAMQNLLHVHLGCMVSFTARRGAINQEFIRVRTVTEAGPAGFKLLEAVDQGRPGSDS